MVNAIEQLQAIAVGQSVEAEIARLILEFHLQYQRGEITKVEYDFLLTETEAIRKEDLRTSAENLVTNVFELGKLLA